MTRKIVFVLIVAMAFAGIRECAIWICIVLVSLIIEPLRRK